MNTKFRESSTFGIVVSLLILQHVLLLLGIFEVPSIVEYGMSNAALMSIWLGREWRASHYTPKE